MFVATLALVLTMSTPQAPGLLPDSTEFRETGSYPFRTGTAVVLDTTRDLAFVGAGSGVFIVDVSDPTYPVVLSDRIRCGTMVKDMFLDGSRLYVALFSYGVLPDLPREVEIWDVSVPANPLRVGGVDLYFGAQCVYARGDTLLIGSLRSLFTYDISDPEHPVRLESLPDVCFPDLIRVRETLAFVAGSASGVLVYDVHSLAHPVLLAQWGATGSYPGLELAGDRLYYASSWGALGPASGLRIYDISDPLHGLLLGAFDTTGENGAYRVAVKDTVALVTWRFDYTGAPPALHVVSVADPSVPRLLATCGGRCTGVALRDTLAYVAFAPRMEIFNIADPSQPVPVGSVPLGLTGFQVVTDNGMAYSVGGSFAILDAHSSLDVELAGVLDLGGNAWALAKDDSLALVAVLDDTGGGRVEVVATADPHAPRVLASLPGITKVRSLLILGSIAYVASESGLGVFNLGDPRNPVRIGGLPRRITGPRLILRDTLLFASDSGDLVVLSVADPSSVFEVLDTAISVDDFLLRDTFLYALPQFLGRNGIWSIGSLPEVRFIGQLATPMNQVFCATLADTFMVLGNASDLIAVHSTTVPESPALLGTLLLKDAVRGLALAGDTLYTSLVNRYRLVRVQSGIELEPIGGVEVRPLRVWPSVAKSVLNLAGRDEAALFDASGRRVLRLKSGPNDVRHLSPGVYFVSERLATGTSRTELRKVLIVR